MHRLLSFLQNLEPGLDQLKVGLGYDHNWVFNNWDGTLKLGVTLFEPESGRFMEVFTTEPGVQFYSGNFLDGTNIGKNQKAYQYRSALCLETDHFPDSQNNSNFPSVVLRPGEEYKQKTFYMRKLRIFLQMQLHNLPKMLHMDCLFLPQ